MQDTLSCKINSELVKETVVYRRLEVGAIAQVFMRRKSVPSCKLNHQVTAEEGK